MVIRVPEGFPALNTAGSSDPHPGDGPDAVLRRGTTFVVHDVRQVPDELYDNDHWVVEAEVVPDGWTPPADWRSTPHDGEGGLPAAPRPESGATGDLMAMPVFTPRSGPAQVPGTVGADGIRRFSSFLEGARYGDQFLDDPRWNRNAFRTRTVEQQRAVLAYTTSSWPYNDVLRARDDDAREELLEDWYDDDGDGFPLYELSGWPLRPPTLQDIQDAYGRPGLTPDQRNMIVDILTSGDPDRTLADLRDDAGRAGHLVDSFGHFPTLQDLYDRISLIDQALDASYLPEPLEAHRGLWGVNFMDGFDPDDPQALVGTVQTEAGYLSTSLGDGAAIIGMPRWPVHLHLTLPAGTRGLWLGGNSTAPEQRELLLPRNTSYRITGVTQDDDGKIHIEAEVLVSPPAHVGGGHSPSSAHPLEEGDPDRTVSDHDNGQDDGRGTGAGRGSGDGSGGGTGRGTPPAGARDGDGVDRPLGDVDVDDTRNGAHPPESTTAPPDGPLDVFGLIKPPFTLPELDPKRLLDPNGLLAPALPRTASDTSRPLPPDVTVMSAFTPEPGLWDSDDLPLPDLDWMATDPAPAQRPDQTPDPGLTPSPGAMDWALDIPSDTDSRPGAVDQEGPVDVDDRPGTIGGDGVRRFATDGEGLSYGDRILGDPDTNPHSYPNLPEDHRRAIDGYTDPDRIPYDRLLRAPDDQTRQRILQELSSDRGWSFPLYELTGPDPRTPTMWDIGVAAGRSDELTLAQQSFVDAILSASDPLEALTHWRDQAGSAARLIDAFGRLPTLEDIAQRVSLIDEAIGRNPLPEPLLVRWDVHDISLLTGYDPDDPDSLVGTVQTERGYPPTSLGAGARVPGSERAPFQFHLALPDGTHGLWLGDRADTRADARGLLLPRGTRYRITGVRTEGTGADRTLHIDATVLPHEPDTGGDRPSPSVDVDNPPDTVGEDASTHDDAGDGAPVTNQDADGLASDQPASSAASTAVRSPTPSPGAGAMDWAPDATPAPDTDSRAGSAAQEGP
ncbi:ADP-ribosyltransferase, partial [Nocardiopsis lucentensis]|uniref:ADP-ribosyltransferase n=1 Tax=Nocardiopsis lucentensis TaxID=53441 RepID=UPI000593646A